MRVFLSHSMETVPSASPDVNDYTPNLGHLVAGTRDTSQGVGSEILQYGPGTNHAQSQSTFANQFQQTSSNSSRKQKYTVPVQTSNDDPERSNAIHHPPLVPQEFSPASCQLSGMIRCRQGNAAPPHNNYRQLLRRILKSLSTEEVNELCYISQEAISAGVQNKINFSGTVLFKFFEQRMLITANNLDYLRDSLQSIDRIDLCKLIDDYTITYVNGPSLSHSEPLTQLHPSYVEPHPPFGESHSQYSYGHPQSLYAGTQEQSSYLEPLPPIGVSRPQSLYTESQSQSYMEPHPQSLFMVPHPRSSYVEPHPQSSSVKLHPQSSSVEPHPQSSFVEPHPQSLYMESHVQPFPPSFNPEFCDPIQLPMSLVQPTPSMNTIHSGLQRVSESRQCSQPTQVVENDQCESQTVHAVACYEKRSLQTDYLRTEVGVLSPHSRVTTPSQNSEHEHNKQLQIELANKDNKIRDLMERISKLEQIVQQKQQHERDSERITEHCIAQMEEVLAQDESRVVAERYEMKCRPHGKAVIINNYEFHSIDPVFEALPTRGGSEIDEENLRVVWKYLRYDVCVFRNLTASQLNQQLAKIALEDHTNFYSFVCCILSHGSSDGIYGTDGELVKISEIIKLFNGNCCPSLVNKPKLFFVQACRGENVDKAVHLEERDGNDVFGDALRNSLPSVTDLLLAYSSPLGYKSWRSLRYGSWYISKLCEVFMDNALQQDLLNMLTMVNKKLSEAYTAEGFKQCPAPVTLLRKQVWFLRNT
ncbi:uncharacterized protein [Dysidea avara]|uniref:uncharacterized protein isoform X2 n=1 Tax=Dysidea avara TaxID=196820 RepID=UPI0033201C1D